MLGQELLYHIIAGGECCWVKAGATGNENKNKKA
jgi:hypothetical protein